MFIGSLTRRTNINNHKIKNIHRNNSHQNECVTDAVVRIITDLRNAKHGERTVLTVEHPTTLLQYVDRKAL